jgi:hypothetical protein
MADSFGAIGVCEMTMEAEVSADADAGMRIFCCVLPVSRAELQRPNG